MREKQNYKSSGTRFLCLPPGGHLSKKTASELLCWFLQYNKKQHLEKNMAYIPKRMPLYYVLRSIIYAPHAYARTYIRARFFRCARKIHQRYIHIYMYGRTAPADLETLKGLRLGIGLGSGCWVGLGQRARLKLTTQVVLCRPAHRGSRHTCIQYATDAKNLIIMNLRLRFWEK